MSQSPTKHTHNNNNNKKHSEKLTPPKDNAASSLCQEQLRDYLTQEA